MKWVRVFRAGPLRGGKYMVRSTEYALLIADWTLLEAKRCETRDSVIFALGSLGGQVLSCSLTRGFILALQQGSHILGAKPVSFAPWPDANCTTSCRKRLRHGAELGEFAFISARELASSAHDANADPGPPGRFVQVIGGCKIVKERNWRGGRGVIAIGRFTGNADSKYTLEHYSNFVAKIKWNL